MVIKNYGKYASQCQFQQQRGGGCQSHSQIQQWPAGWARGGIFGQVLSLDDAQIKPRQIVEKQVRTRAYQLFNGCYTCPD